MKKGWKGESKRHAIAAKKNRGGSKMSVKEKISALLKKETGLNFAITKVTADFPNEDKYIFESSGVDQRKFGIFSYVFSVLDIEGVAQIGNINSRITIQYHWELISGGSSGDRIVIQMPTKEFLK